MNPRSCGRCRRALEGTSGFFLDAGWRCFWCAATYTPILYRSAKTAAVVGTILVGINVIPSIMSGDSASAFWKIPLNYVVPFCVATWGALSNSRPQLPR